MFLDYKPGPQSVWRQT